MQGQFFRILFVQGETQLLPVFEFLGKCSYDVTLVSGGRAATRSFDEPWDVIILDHLLSDIPAASVIGYLRQHPDSPAVLVLSTKSSVEEKVSFFRRGCDDFLCEPFHLEEIHARVEALLRRPRRVKAETFRYEELVLEPESYRLTAENFHVLLTPKEASILRLFMSSPGRVISRKEILHHVWGLKEEPETNFIGVHLFNLRKKLGNVRRKSWLRTVRQSGFILDKPQLELMPFTSNESPPPKCFPPSRSRRGAG